MLRAALIALLMPCAAIAQSFELDVAPRLGVAVGPAYPGASEYDVGPDVGFSFGRLSLGGARFGSDYERILGLGFSPSVGYIGERDSSDYSEIAGLNDVDETFELGIGGIYRWEEAEVFAKLRRGFGGHEGFVADLGADYIARPTERLLLRAGPRMSLGDDDYASSYFGVSAAESVATGGRLGAFDAGGGVTSAGLEAVATYRLGGDWAVEGGISYDRLLGDAGDSPITEAGSEDQFGLRLGVSKRIRFGF